MTMPNFLIIGAERSGTTSLYHYLKQHPQIYMSPVKEPRFFAYSGEQPDFRGPGDQEKLPRFIALEAYQSLFAGVTDEVAIGEASVIYLYSSKAPMRIRHYIPDVKLIAILRHPVDRAYSRFWGNLVTSGHEPLSDFSQALEAEEMRIRDNWHPRWHYRQQGFYYAQLRHYFDLFDQSQIRVYLIEDLATDPVSLLQDIFRFLKIDEMFEPQVTTRYHLTSARGRPRNKVLNAFLSKPNPIRAILRPFLPARLRRNIVSKLTTLNTIPRPPLSPELREALIQEYREDILSLEGLIQRDLSGWLEQTPCKEADDE